MAYYAALVPVVQLLEDIIHDHVRYPDFDLRKQPIIKSLHEKFTLLQKSLDDNYYSSNGDKASDDLERRIRDIAYRAQDIIESQISEDKTEKTHTVQRFFYLLIVVMCSQCQPDHGDVSLEGLQRVEEEVDSILKELAKIKDFAAGSSSSKSDKVDDDYVDIGSTGSKQAHAPAGSTTMVGFNEQLIAIKKHLCGGKASELQTVPITGMGGIGKTTLARNIFADELIVNYFDVCAWVTVSQDYDSKRMLQAILDSISAVPRESSRELSFTQLSLDIHKQLINRRYLLIIDDIWSTNVLDDINRISPDDNNGSRIMITTRLSDVAAYATTSGSPLHQMQSLNEKQSWDLLREKVFAQEDRHVCPPELEGPGRSIVRNCRGLPLAIVVIAGVLSKIKRTQTDWNKIASNVNSVVAEKDEHVSRILSLSYNHLPHNLKPCFLYIGGFPEDHEISVSKLIKLWIAEGFLSNNNPTLVEESISSFKRRSLEEVGEQYLEDLVKRNLILVTRKSSYNGKIEVCGIHDVLRDLCQQRIRNEKFFHFTGKYGKLPKDRENNVRRACLYPYYDGFCFGLHHLYSRFITEAVPDSTARSILCFGNYAMKNNWNNILGCFELLRVFDALEIKFVSFPDKLLELFHLRYLALHLDPDSTTTELISISPSISQLQNLQTVIVKLKDKVNLLLPSNMWKMPLLRHILIDRLTLLLSIPSDHSRLVGSSGEIPLENLQTLSEVVNFRFTEEAVAMVPNLKILKVKYTEPDKGIWEWLNSLSNLRQLEELKINLGIYRGGFPKINDNNNSGFAFPQSLKKLSLFNSNIPWERLGSVVGCLPNLEALEISDFDDMNESSEEWEPKEGEFRSLKYLQIEYCFNLKCWRADETHFPRLVHLKLKGCVQLQEIPLGIGDIPTLEFIEVLDCSNSVTDSANLIQQQQKDMGNDTLIINITRTCNKGTLDWYLITAKLRNRVS